MKQFFPKAPCLIATILAVLSAPVSAHEFWISPVTYSIQTGEQAEANLRVGENFIGPAYSYQPRQFERFEIIQGGTVLPVEGRLGDIPALKVDDLSDGLAVIVHETKDNTLTYREWAKFEKFVNHKAMAGVLEAHVERGIRQEDFKEDYRRFAKALIAVGSGIGADQETGLKTEIVALNNPFTEDISEMAVKVLLDGKPRVDAQIELFVRDTGGEIDLQLYRTDTAGIGRFPVKPGYEYLVDAVAMEALPNDDPEDGAVWRSLWAALTFKMPER